MNNDTIKNLVINNNMNVLKQLYDEGVHIINHPYDYLYIAIIHQHIELIQFFVEHGSDLTKNNYCAFEGALFTQNSNIIYYFIEHIQDKKSLLSFIEQLKISKSTMTQDEINANLIPDDNIIDEIYSYLNNNFLNQSTSNIVYQNFKNQL